MLRKARKRPQTVADKVHKLLAHPNASDSEENGSDVDLGGATNIADFEEDAYDLPDGRSTEFRKRNVKLLSEQSAQYKGVITSRKEIENDRSSDNDEELSYEESDSDDADISNKKLIMQMQEDSDDDSILGFNTNGQAVAEDSEDEDAVDDEGSMDEDGDAISGEDDEGAYDDVDDDDLDGDTPIGPQNTMSQTNQLAEIQKGLCVQNQLCIWERLLELRINTQKITSKANKLPPPETLQTLSADSSELKSALNDMQQGSAKLLDQLLALQFALAQQNSEMCKLVSREQPAKVSQESDPVSKRYAKALHTNFQGMRSYRNEVLLKWDDRTKLLTPGAGSKRKTLQEDFDVIKKISNTLANRETLIEKSQILKSGQENADDVDTVQRQPHIYDDSDFYHQQLRELIEYKASTTSSTSEITRQFVELQKLRQKMKKKVDTRASKGRKLRYVVHNKLINFMAPNENCDWTESAKMELYKSLFA